MEKITLKVRKIGNSKGIVLPKKYLRIVETANETVKINVDETGILIKSTAEKPRKGWGKSFKKMKKNKDDKLLLPGVFQDESFEKWK